MVNLKLLEKRGISVEKLKALLSREEKDPAVSEKLKNFRLRLSSRIRRGIDANISKGYIFHALDSAYDLPFKQVSPTLLNTLLDKDADDEKVKSAINAYGFDLNSVVIESKDEKTGKTIRKVNAPAFFAVYVPLVKAYIAIRWGKIMNDRRLVPFLKYEPAISDPKSRTQCEALTSRIEVMSNQMGYFNAVKQAVFYMLLYSVCLKFPTEEWYVEKQETEKQEDDTIEEGEGDKKRFFRITKEGIRYHHPHPSRIFYDEAYKLSSFNTDSGCEFAGFWKVLRYKDLRNNSSYYNTDKITVGDLKFWNNASLFFNTVYNCTIEIPQPVASSVSNDRESKMAETTYSDVMDDKSVLVSDYYEKIIPSECGLGDYDCPVWFRFVVAGFDTILYAAPLPYCPAIYYGYDPDENRSMNSSLGMEVLPFQDQVSNLFSQYLLAVKQNLTNITFVDEDVVGDTWLNKIKNYGEKLWRGHNFMPFSSAKLKKHQHDHRQAFYSHKFPYLDTNGILQAINTVLQVMERTLVMSSQEIAQAASHEQTREEVKNISQSTSTRLTFTSHPVDDAREAMKMQLYLGLMAYGQDEFYAQIPFESTLTKEKLKELGFTWAEGSEEKDMDGNIKRVSAKANKNTAIALVKFAANRDGNDRIDNTQNAVQMANALASWMGNPILSAAIGPDQGIMMLNMISRMAGFPREFKLQNKAPQVEQQQNEQQQQLIELLKKLKDTILGEVQAGLQPILDKEKELDARLISIEDLLRNAPSPSNPLINDTGINPTSDYGAAEQAPPVAAPAGIPTF